MAADRGGCPECSFSFIPWLIWTFEGAIVQEIHTAGYDQGQHEVASQDKEHRLDFLSGLHERNPAESCHDVVIADGDGKRRVLGQVKVVARKRRNDQRHRLRNDHELQRPVRRHTKRERRFTLPLVDREDAAAYNLGDEA